MFKRKCIFVIALLLSAFNLCYSGQQLDYSEIAPHPRLLLSESEKVKVKEAVELNSQLKSIHDYIITMSDDFLNKGVVVYEKTGKRLLAVSREALTRIFFLSYAYQMTDDTKYLNKAELELNAVCDFDDWNPSHFLDVGEMTMAVAIGYDWLYSDLKPATKENIKRAILNYAFVPSKMNAYNNFLRLTSNWNQVCNAGLVYGALAIFDEHKTESIEIIERALQTNPLAMESYSPDGNYPEGAGYWGYGTSFQVMMIAALESALGSDAGLSQTLGFLQSAEYMMFVNGPIKLCFNYSDCSKNQSANIPMFWFAKKTNNPNLLFEEKKLMEEGLFFKRLDEERLLPALLTFAHSFDFSNISPPQKTVWSGQGITPVVLVRTDWTSANSEYLGVKGGSAITSHAHMDAGSFVYDSEELRWAMDLGLQSYITLESKGIDIGNMSQNSPRWGVFRYNNNNHNTLTINGKNHKVDGKAYLIETYDTNLQRGGKFDLSEIFSDDIESVFRKVVLKDDSYLEITDEIATTNKSAQVRWTMVTPAEVQIINSNTIELIQKGKKKQMTVISECPFELKIWNSEDPGTDYDALNPGTIMIGFESVVPANKTTEYVVTLKSGGDVVLIKNDFLSSYNIGDNLEQGTYTSTGEATSVFQNTWMYKNGSAVANTKVIAPLTYTGYVESGVDNAFEVAKLSSGSGTLGYSLTNTDKYNSGSYYLAFMISINDNLGINVTDRTRNMIGFNTKFTLDLSRVVLSVSKDGSTTGFKFGIGAKHSTSAGKYPMAWSSSEYSFNQTYLAVLKYDFLTKKASLFINPVISSSEPSPLLEITMTDDDANGMVARGIRAICLEQSSADSRKIGGIRFSNTWEGAIGENDGQAMFFNPLSENTGRIVNQYYIDLTGVFTTQPQIGNFYIKKTLFENGTIKSEKIIFKK